MQNIGRNSGGPYYYKVCSGALGDPAKKGHCRCSHAIAALHSSEKNTLYCLIGLQVTKCLCYIPSKLLTSSKVILITGLWPCITWPCFLYNECNFNSSPTHPSCILRLGHLILTLASIGTAVEVHRFPQYFADSEWSLLPRFKTQAKQCW